MVATGVKLILFFGWIRKLTPVGSTVTGVAGVFVLGVAEGDQMVGWNIARWASYFDDPSHADVKLTSSGLPAASFVTMAGGLCEASDCKTVTLK